MRKRIKRVYVSDELVSTYPADQGWRIFNAPRPLTGTQTWVGDFLSGVFYAAVALDDPNRDYCLQANFNLDAVELVPISKEEFEHRITQIKRELEEQYGDRWLRLDVGMQRTLAIHNYESNLRKDYWTPDEEA
jgi:hypothetical protein